MSVARASASRIRQLNKSQAAALIATRLGISASISEEELLRTVLAETVREVVFTYAVRAKETTPVHVQTITNQVQRSLSLIWVQLQRQLRNLWLAPEESLENDDADEVDEEQSPIRRTLLVLSTVGDLHHAGSGYWLPTPTRLIRLAGAVDHSTTLVIGGAPLAQLRRDGYKGVSVFGSVRALPSHDIPNAVIEDDSAWQDPSTWLRVPREPLVQWANALMHRARQEQSQSHSEIDAFDVYDPHGHRRDAQYFRWTSARQFHPTKDALYLCRSSVEAAAGARRYWVGSLTQAQGETRPVSECPITGPTIRRLQYALDALAGAPTRAAIKHSDQQSELTLYSYLPQAEHRFLTAVARDTSERPGRLPMRYLVPRGAMESALELLSGLSMELR